jgi:hypothetical protein
MDKVIHGAQGNIRIVVYPGSADQGDGEKQYKGSSNDAGEVCFSSLGIHTLPLQMFRPWSSLPYL